MPAPRGVVLGGVDPYAGYRQHVRLPAADLKTYTIRQPRDRGVVAACHQVGCVHWRDGWDSVIDETTDLGRAQAAWIRTGSGRTFREGRTRTGLTVFRFECHQRCFTEHRTRPQRFGVVGGDARGNPLHIPPRIHQRPEDWVEDAGEHQQRLAALRARG